MAARGYTLQTDITGTATQLTSSSPTTSYGFTVRAHSANTQKVYLGYSNAVAVTTGYELGAGEAYWISKNQADGPADIYLISASGTQRVSVAGE